MNLESHQVLSFSTTPVILISACCLFALALYNRMAIIISRQRILNRERVQENNNEDFKKALKINMLKSQSDLIMRRARMIQKSLLFLNYTILSMILCSFFSGLSYYISIIDYLAIGTFWLALLFFSIAVFFSVKELLLVIKTINNEKIFIEEYY